MWDESPYTIISLEAHTWILLIFALSAKHRHDSWLFIRAQPVLTLTEFIQENQHLSLHWCFYTEAIISVSTIHLISFPFPNTFPSIFHPFTCLFALWQHLLPCNELRVHWCLSSCLVYYFSCGSLISTFRHYVPEFHFCVPWLREECLCIQLWSTTMFFF